MHPKNAAKPRWPYGHIVSMFAAGNGQWAKKIHGKRMNFGPWRDPKAALDRYEVEGRPIQRGETAGPIRPSDVTVEALCQHFIVAKAAQVKSGDLSARMYDDYRRVCAIIRDTLGERTLVALLRPEAFIKLRQALGPSKTRRANQIVWARTVFKWGYDSDFLDRPVKMGLDFKRPKARELRSHKNKRGRGRLYTPDQVQALVDNASTLLKALILLAINAGFGNTDCASLTLKDVDLDKGLIDTERHKTGFERTATLWPETVDAMREYLKGRHGRGDAFFLTPQGDVLVKVTHRPDPEHPDGLEVVKVDWVAQWFGKLAREQGLRGKGFYDLRHTFRTVAESGAFRERTIDRIMGHIQGGMGTEYIHDFSPEKLRAVTDYVRAWYLKTHSASAGAGVPSVSPGTPPASV